MLRLLAGWEDPSHGSLERIGIHRISWIFQHPRGIPSRTAEDHIVLALLARGHSAASAHGSARERLSMVGLEHVATTPYGELSAGQRQVLMFARGFASDPDLILVDEPTAQLDSYAARSVNHIISSLQGSGRIMVIATRDQHTIDACTDVIDLSC